MLAEALLDALGSARASFEGAVGAEAAQLGVSHLRSAVGPEIFPSIYRHQAGRLWLVAQAGYLEVFDGIGTDRGVLARAARTGEVQFVEDAASEPEFLHAQPGFVSEVTVPVAEYLVNIEATARLEERVVAPFADFARELVGRIRLGRPTGAAQVATARALGQMVVLSTREQIGEYAARLVGQHLDLAVAQVVVHGADSSLLSVLWRGTAGAPAIPPAQAMRMIESKRAYTAWIGGRPAGFELWPEAGRFVIVPIFRRGSLSGGLVGAGGEINPTQVETETLAAVAAHASACLERVTLEEELTSALTARSDVVAAVSHELRTPLTAIVGYSDILLASPRIDGEEREFVEIVKQNAAHLQRLVGDILDVAKAEAGRLAVSTEQRVELRPLVAEIARFVTPQAREREVKLQVHVPAGLAVLGDEVRIRQIVVNLLSNAVKFSRESLVEVVAEVDGRYVSLEVRDEGEGISPEDLQSLFRPFTGRSVRDPSAGTGLGLVISRRLAEAMGGTLALDSPGRGLGAVARLRLPHHS